MTLGRKARDLETTVAGLELLVASFRASGSNGFTVVTGQPGLGDPANQFTPTLSLLNPELTPGIVSSSWNTTGYRANTWNVYLKGAYSNQFPHFVDVRFEPLAPNVSTMFSASVAPQVLESVLTGSNPRIVLGFTSGSITNNVYSGSFYNPPGNFGDLNLLVVAKNRPGR